LLTEYARQNCAALQNARLAVPRQESNAFSNPQYKRNAVILQAFSLYFWAAGIRFPAAF
jgi:hypothetical protein